MALSLTLGSNTGLTIIAAAILSPGMLAWVFLWLSQMLKLQRMANRGWLRDVSPNAVAFRIVFEPVLLVLLGILLWSHQLTRARLALSSGVIDAFAASVHRDGILAADSDLERQLGLFSVHQVRVSNGAVKLFTCPNGVFGASGLLYAPNSKPENIGEESFTHLNGNWYAWKQNW